MKRKRKLPETITCYECGEPLKWYELTNEGLCPICGAVVDNDTWDNPGLFDSPEQIFITNQIEVKR